MPVFVFIKSKGVYHQSQDSPHSLVYLLCKKCNSETPQALDVCAGGYIAVCAVCLNEEKFCSFVLHDKCKNYIEAVGFILVPAKKLLVAKSSIDFGRHDEKKIPVVIWCPDPIDHKDICGQPIKVPP
mgnify:CR=1 FL=1